MRIASQPHRSAVVVTCATLTAAAVLAIAPPAAAQTAPVPTFRQTVVVTATVTPTNMESVARPVSILTREDLDLLGVRSIIEGLRLVPGVDARARGPRDVQTDFSIRGATFGQNLILVDGMRINDSQSGHHNGEIPIPVTAIDRVEVVAGAGSAVHGADALGGTINVVSRRGTFAEVSASAGEHGYADVQAVTSGRRLPDSWTLAGWGSRSSGFTTNRDFAIGGVSLGGHIVRGVTVDVRHQRRAFGAQGFYGNSDSKEWTDQTLVGITATHTSGDWTTTGRGLVRRHADHFLWSQLNPGISRNRHRTTGNEGTFELSRRASRGTWSTGLSGGTEEVASSNLQNHDYDKLSAFTEWQGALGSRGSANFGLRYDWYTSFGSALSPSISGVVSLTTNLRARASVAHAFRVPTFTELYYSDPNNLGSPDLESERSWSLDGGLDWTRRAWTASLSVFRRWDDSVIDWVRQTPTERWRSTNVRDVRARGFEASVGRRWASALVRVHYAGLHLDAPSLALLSKYVLEYARHQSGGSVAVPVGGGVKLAVNVDYRHRRDGQSYGLVGAQMSRRIGRVDLSVDGLNLLNADYHEVAGVEMPGRWLTFGVRVR